MSDDAVAQLIRQLRAPDERLDWWPVRGNEPPQVRALFERGCSHTLVVPVRRDPGPPISAALARPPEPAGQPIRLQRLQPPSGRQQIAQPFGSTDATHLLVMGWARHHPEDPTWYSAPFAGPSPSLDADTLQQALNRLSATTPGLLEASLLALPAAQTSAGHAAPHQHWRAAHLNAAAAPMGPPADGRTRFAFASCQYPPGLLDRLPAEASLSRLAQIAAAKPLDAVLILGDQIYADASYGLLDAVAVEDRFVQRYHTLHDTVKKFPALHALRHQHLWYSTPDDHEISDNWEPGHASSDALESYQHHRLGTKPERQPTGGFWGELALGGGHRVFMLDTRCERTRRPWPKGDEPAPRIMSEAQDAALKRWLRTTKSPIRWVSSPVWLLPRRMGRILDHEHTEALDPLLCDDWSGYPASLHGLLGYIALERIPHVVMLCGDAHLAGHTVLTLRASAQTTNPPTRVDVLHCPALYAPFTFANAQPHHYLLTDQLSGGQGESAWHCEVRSQLWPLGDGFVSVACDDGYTASPQVTATFHAQRPRTLHIP